VLPAAAAGVHAEPSNALSLPTWAIHVSSVLEWTTAMALVWRFADVSGATELCDWCALSTLYTRQGCQRQRHAGQERKRLCLTVMVAPVNAAGQPQWKGLTWGMMPLLAGALCACTHHFFYNDPKLDSLVALQVGHSLFQTLYRCCRPHNMGCLHHGEPF
jgi:Protein of unknown function (DUF2499)